MMSSRFITPNWPAPKNIKAFTSTRLSGVSEGAWANLNVAQHVGDDSNNVEKNRVILANDTKMPNPKWLEQTHSTKVVEHRGHTSEADGCFTQELNSACVVMTADCLPVLLCNQKGDWVAAIHAGWRGLAQGILSEAINKYSGESSLMAWIGPAIRQQRFEVGDDVKRAFTQKSDVLADYFKVSNNGKWLCDLAGIAAQELKSSDVDVFKSGLCTYDNAELFYSHRRITHESKTSVTTGRMATAIWLQNKE